MNIFKNAAWAAILVITAAIVIACGGGGGGSSSSANGGSVGLFFTDDLSANYDHVFVTAHKVSFTGPAGTRTIFNSTDGKTIDLRALGTAQGGTFAFLAHANVPSGSYTSAEIELDKDLVLFPTGNNVGQQRVFAGSDVPNDRKTITVPLSLNVSGHHNVTFDFDLAQWTDDGTNVTPFVAVTNDPRFDDSGNHENEDFHGAISALSGTAPNQTFTLSSSDSGSLTVKVDATTSIFNSDGTASPVLANGKHVEVRGNYDPAQDALIATSVKIEDNANEDHEDHAFGAVTNINAGAGTFTVHVSDSHGFAPTVLDVNVVTNVNTRFFGHRGVVLSSADFFTGLAGSSFAEVEGTYDEGTNTFTASKAKLEDEGHHGGGGDHGDEAEVTGLSSNAVLESHTFQMMVTSFEGVGLTNGMTVTVNTSGVTEFKLNGNTVGESTFYSALTDGTSVKIEGGYNSDTNTLTAREAKIGSGGGGGGNNDGGAQEGGDGF